MFRRFPQLRKNPRQHREALGDVGRSPEIGFHLNGGERDGIQVKIWQVQTESSSVAHRKIKFNSTGAATFHRGAFLALNGPFVPS